MEIIWQNYKIVRISNNYHGNRRINVSSFQNDHETTIMIQWICRYERVLKQIHTGLPALSAYINETEFCSVIKLTLKGD